MTLIARSLLALFTSSAIRCSSSSDIPRALAAEERGDRLGAGAVEEGVDEVPQRGPARGLPRHGRHVDVAQALLLVAHVPFVLEHAELGADGGVARRARHLRP